MSQRNEIVKLRTPKARVSFAHVFKPQAPMNNPSGDPMYSVVLLFDKNEDLSALKQLAKDAAIAKFGADAIAKKQINLRSPFRDGEEKAQKYEGYEGKIFITCKSKNRPKVVDKDPSIVLTDDSEFYSGCFARAMINAYAYDNKGNKGVGFGLISLQKMADGERFSGFSSNPEEDFENLDDGSDDDTTSNYKEVEESIF